MLAAIVSVLLQAAAPAGDPPAIAQVGGAAPFTPPVWTPTDFSAAYPHSALVQGIRGLVTMRCVITEPGVLSDCEVAEETPTGYGFGRAALSLAPKFALTMPTRDGVPVPGIKIKVPIRWSLPH
jgi:periplasmic protein TonB